MNKKYWLDKFNIGINCDVIFYQNPNLFRTNSFKREYLETEGKNKLFVITGVYNSHTHKTGKTAKICFVVEN